MKGQRRSILHVDLDPFFLSVERGLDPLLRGRPVVVGGDGQGIGFVAAVSAEAQALGVRAGMPLSEARRLCPEAVFRRGDLEAYGRVSDEVTAVLLAASRRVERPSADEAFVDLTPETTPVTSPVQAAETIRDELQRRLGLDVSLGLASSRLAARIASTWARPRGLLVVLPGYEPSFLAGKPVAALGLPPHLATALERAGLATLGALTEADDRILRSVAGPLASRLRAAACGDGEAPIPVTAPPVSLQEEATLRDSRSDRVAIEDVVQGLARRAARRLRPFRLRAGALTVEVRRSTDIERRGLLLRPSLADEEELASLARTLACPLIDSPESIRAVSVRLSRLEMSTSQVPLFPVVLALREA